MIGRALVHHAALLGIFLVSFSSLAAEPRFEEYKVNRIFKGDNHELVVEDDEDNWSLYRKQAIKKPVNFAGHYIVFAMGCGGGAICGEILDAQTGSIAASFPNAYEMDSPDGSYYDASFKLDSRLMVISGVAGDPEVGLAGEKLASANRTRYFELKDNKLKLLMIVDE
jgi:hypothetical protein